jgi:hypothetical protein
MIDINKKYKLRMGGDVVIFEKCEGKIFGKYKVNPTCEWNASRWDSNGHYQICDESCLDLIEISPYADLKIDDKVLVWDDGQIDPYKYHFAGIDGDGRALTWDDGQTSFTSNEYEVSTWDNCIKYEEENDKT